METIFYFYRWKRLDITCEMLTMEELYRRDDFSMQDYHLVKVGMSEQLLRICQDHCMKERSRRSKESGGFFARRYRKKQRKAEQELLMQFMTELEIDVDGSSFVCEEPIAYLAGREFNGYFQADFVRHMLRYAGADYRECEKVKTKEQILSRTVLNHYMILGQAYCLPEIIYESVRNMKSLKWILPERQFRLEQQELVDILYEEYGLAVEVRLLTEHEKYMQVPPICRIPSLVLDFSEEDRIPTADVARGSIWLDMASSEEKRRRLEDRNTGIYYYSLKKEWKQPQKACNHLDTISKNGYNT